MTARDVLEAAVWAAFAEHRACRNGDGCAFCEHAVQEILTAAAEYAAVPARERDAARAVTDRLRERAARLAAALDAEADITSPSRKSEVQRDAARRIRQLLEET